MQNDILTEQSGYLQDQIVKNQEQTLLLSILLGILAGMLFIHGFFIGRK